MEYNEVKGDTDHITLPYVADDALIRETIKGMKD
jgi:hypothetical protein